MAVSGRRNKSEAVKEFAEFFEKVLSYQTSILSMCKTLCLLQIRDSGQQASTSDIIRFSKLFEDELTLDNLNTPTLKALCRLLLLQPIGSSNFLRFQLRMKLRQLMADDKVGRCLLSQWQYALFCLLDDPAGGGGVTDSC